MRKLQFIALLACANLFLSNSAQATTELVGELKGQFSVGSQGGAVYNIPIELPEGVGGLRPEAGISYSSNQEGGVLGVGWGLAGLSSIQRCGAQDEIDGFDSVVQFTERDRLCLDGAPLIAVQGEYGRDGTVYHPAADPATRIISVGDISATGDDFPTFEVHTKAGEVLIYGEVEPGDRNACGIKTLLGRPLVFDEFSEEELGVPLSLLPVLAPYIIGHGNITDGWVYHWSLTSRRDSKGNEVSYNYSCRATQEGPTPFGESSAHDEHLLKSISYLVNENDEVNVSYHYESRPDVETAYEYGRPIYKKQRLKSVRVSVAGSLLHVIHASYQVSPTTLKSQLTQVQQCFPSGNCLKPTVFDWSNAGESYGASLRFTDSADFSPPTDLHDGKTGLAELIDLNGDGLPDWLMTKAHGAYSEPATWLNTGSGWKRAPSWDIPVPLSSKDGRLGWLNDMDGDGRPDLVVTQGGSTKIFLNGDQGWSSVVYSMPHPLIKDNKPKGLVVDINADDLADVVFSAEEGPQVVFLNQGCVSNFCQFHSETGFLPEVIFHADGGLRMQLVDYDTDGDIDLQPYSRKDESAQFFWHDNEWVKGETYTARTDASRETVTRIFSNRDATPDSLYSRWNAHSSMENFSLRLIDGTGMIVRNGERYGSSAATSSYTTGWTGNYLYVQSYSGRPLIADFDGDGHLDMLVDSTQPNPNDPFAKFFKPYDASFNLYSAKYRLPGAIEDPTAKLSSHVDENFTGGNSPLQYVKLAGNVSPTSFGLAIDINGDSKPDLLSGGGGIERRAMLHSGSYGDRIQGITSGLGTRIEVSYGVATDTSLHVPEQNKKPDFYYPATPTHLVSSYRSISSGGERVTNYQYGGYAIKKNHLSNPGPRGFRWIAISDADTGVTEKTWYSQDWPTVGAVEQALTYDRTAEVPSVIATCPTSGQGLHRCTEAAYVLQHPTKLPRFTYAETRKSFQYGDSGTLLADKVVEQFDVDSYGNIDRVVTTTTDHLTGDIYVQDATHSYKNDEQNWWLARLERSSVTHTSPFGTLTKTAAFEYSPTTGHLVAEVTEPDQLGTPQYLRKEYEYDQYGLVKKETSHGYHHDGVEMQPRTTSTFTSYLNHPDNGPIKQVVTTNGLAHSETIHTDMRHGGVIYQLGPNGIATTWVYDELGRAITENRADGTNTETRRQWPDHGAPLGASYQVSTHTSGTATVTQYFDSNGRGLRKAHSAMDGTQVYEDTEYDGLGQKTRTSRAYYEGEEPIWATFTYDEKQRLETQTVPGPEGPAITHYEYEDNATIVTNPHGHSTTTVRNVHGKSVEITDSASGVLSHNYGVTGELVHTEDPIGQETRLEYDIHNRKLAMHDPHMGHWQYRYNSYGELEWQRDAEGNEVTMQYDLLGRLVQRDELEGQSLWQYDFPEGSTLSQGKSLRTIGKLVSVSGPNGYKKTHKYDELGRAYETTTWHNSESFRVSTEYDEYSRPRVSIRPDGFVVENVYNELGYLVAIRSPQELAGDYDRTHLAAVLQQTLAAAEAAAQEVLALQNDVDRYRSEADRFRTLAADATYYSENQEEGRLALLAAADQLDDIADELTITANDYMEQVEYCNNVIAWVENTLREAGSLASTEDVVHLTYVAEWHRTYAAVKLEQAETLLLWADVRSSQAESLRAQEQDASALWAQKQQEFLQTALAYANDAEEALARSAEAEVEAQALQIHAALVAQNLEDENYAVWWRADQTDAEGRITRSVVGNGLLTQRYYNATTGQLDTIDTGAVFRSSVQALSYEYDNMNNVRFRYDDARGSVDSYHYDSLDRIKSWQYQAGTSAETDGDSWQYDGIGNIDYSDRVGDYQYSYNDYNGYKLSSTDSHGEIHYNNNGHITNRGEQRYDWTSFGKPYRLEGAQNSSEFRYAPDRARYQQFEINQGEDAYQRTTYYVGKLYEKIVTDRDGSIRTQRKHYLYAGSELVGVHTRFGEDDSQATTGAQTRYFHKDALGSISAITDQRGNTVAQYRYRPFGEQVALEKLDHTDQVYAAGFAPITTRGYTGHEHLSKLNLIHMNGRVYDPTLARFLSADPHIQSPENGQNYNRYSYVTNNPLKYTDPSGYFLKKLFKSVVDIFKSLLRSQVFMMIADVVVAA
jgi:RHS repeat-associated protein